MMQISAITDYLTISSKVTKENVNTILDLDPRLVISMIVQRKPPEALAQPPRIVLWLRTFDFPLLPIPLRTLNRGVLAALPVSQDSKVIGMKTTPLNKEYAYEQAHTHRC
jgi:hypothetical protein